VLLSHSRGFVVCSVNDSPKENGVWEINGCNCFKVEASMAIPESNSARCRVFAVSPALWFGGNA